MILLQQSIMLGSSFALDPVALTVAIPFCLGCYILHRLKKRMPSPRIDISNLGFFCTPSQCGWKERLHFLPSFFKWFAFLALLLAFLDFRFYIPLSENSRLFPQESLATEGIAIYLVLDQSGSMSEKITTRIPGEGLQSISKIDLVKYVTSLFIKGDSALGLAGRPNDLIGLVEFARTAQIAVPLTLDRKELLDKLAKFKSVKNPSEDGTAIGYAMLKTAYLIQATRNYARDLMGKGKPAYEIKNSVIILVTDGLQDPNPADKGSKWRQMDPREVALSLKEEGIRIYIVNVEPKFANEAYAANRRQLEQAAEMTGGKLYMINNGRSLDDIYASIDAIEKSKISIEENLAETLKHKLAKEKLPGLYHTLFLAPYLIALAIGCLILGVFLESTLLRKVP